MKIEKQIYEWRFKRENVKIQTRRILQQLYKQKYVKDSVGPEVDDKKAQDNSSE